ncbi:hypothetical protein ACLOJK_019176 [Asimina triloba]
MGRVAADDLKKKAVRSEEDVVTSVIVESKRKKMAAIVDRDGAAVNFKQMLSITASRLARREKMMPTITTRFAALLAGNNEDASLLISMGRRS